MRLQKWIMSVALAALAPCALGQEAPKYDVLKKMYEDAVGSLKSAQDAKNSLAMKNEELTKQVADLQKQLEAVSKDRDELQRQASSYAERTFNLRTHYGAWQQFMKRYPTLAAKWKVFLEAELLKPENDAPSLAEPLWPFRIDG